MISWVEVHAGVYGALRLARRDPQGMVWINDSPTGFWRSFWALALVLPGVMALELLTGGFGDDLGLRAVLVKLEFYVIEAVVYPLLMVTVATSLGRFHRYWRYVAVYNWAAVVQVGLLLPVVALVVLTESPMLMLLLQALTILMLVYRAYLAHVALEVGLGTAAGITLMDVLVSRVLRELADRVMVGLW